MITFVLAAALVLLAWTVLIHLPAMRERRGYETRLRAAIEAQWAGRVGPAVETCMGHDVYVYHECSVTDGHEALCADALTFVRKVQDAIAPSTNTLHRVGGVLLTGSTWCKEFTLHWATPPTFHICTEDGIRTTCLLLRFRLSPVLNTQELP